MWAGFGEKKSFDGKFWWVQDDKWFESLSWYVLISVSTGESGLQDGAGKTQCLKPWEGTGGAEGWFVILVKPSLYACPEAKQTSTDTNGVWSATLLQDKRCQVQGVVGCYLNWFLVLDRPGTFTGLLCKQRNESY